MSNAKTVVRPLLPADRAEWLPMWDAYCAFYEVSIPRRITDHTWRRLCDEEGPVRGLIACDAGDGSALGFAQYVVHPYTWSDHPACYLEDLFVRPVARGAGIGRALIEHLLALARASHWSRVYWMTRESNDVARRLYDRIGERDDFVRYVVALDER